MCVHQASHPSVHQLLEFVCLMLPVMHVFLDPAMRETLSQSSDCPLACHVWALSARPGCASCASHVCAPRVSHV